LQLDFGEQGQQKRVILLDAKAAKPVHLESIPLISGRKLRYATGTIEELQVAAPQFGNDYLSITVKTAGPVPGIADRIRDLLPNAVHITPEFPRSTPAQHARRDMAPHLMFTAFYESQHGAPPAQELLQAFQAIYEEVTDASSKA